MFRRVRQTGELGAVQNSARAMAKKRSGHSPRGVLPTPTSKAKRTRAGNLAAIDRASLSVLGVRISHPDRLIYADLGIAKIQIARYYERIGDWIVPHVAGRPLTLVHCPAGIAASCHYLKHAKAWGPSALRRVRIREKTKVGEYLVADSTEALVSLAQMGIVEIHTWNSTADDIERPNRRRIPSCMCPWVGDRLRRTRCT